MSDPINDAADLPMVSLPGFLFLAVFAASYFLRPRPLPIEPSFELVAFDPELGEIGYDPQRRMLRVQPFFEGRRIAIVLLDAEPPPSGLQPVWDICPGLDRIARSGREVAVRDLLALANSDWRRSGEPERDAAAFGSLALDEVVAARNGSFRLRFDDDGLFWGHQVQVEGRWDDGSATAHILT